MMPLCGFVRSPLHACLAAGGIAALTGWLLANSPNAIAKPISISCGVEDIDRFTMAHSVVEVRPIAVSQYRLGKLTVRERFAFTPPEQSQEAKPARRKHAFSRSLPSPQSSIGSGIASRTSVVASFEVGNVFKGKIRVGARVTLRDNCTDTSRADIYFHSANVRLRCSAQHSDAQGRMHLTGIRASNGFAKIPKSKSHFLFLSRNPSGDVQIVPSGAPLAQSFRELKLPEDGDCGRKFARRGSDVEKDPSFTRLQSRMKTLREQQGNVGKYPKLPWSNPHKSAKSGYEFQECDVCPKMVVVPGRSFVMGARVNGNGRQSDERPERRVSFAMPFAVGKFEVTYDEWDACFAGGHCWYKNDYGEGRGKRPVAGLSWEDAKIYIAWLTRKTREQYRLLTEAEWEYAARAGSETSFSKDPQNTAHIKGSNANHGFRKGKASGRALAVGSFPANRFGLHDMFGNVAEWLEDCHIAGDEGAPNDGEPRSRAGPCDRHVVRGGSYVSGSNQIRSKVRDRFGDLGQGVGIRVAKTLDP